MYIFAIFFLFFQLWSPTSLQDFLKVKGWQSNDKRGYPVSGDVYGFKTSGSYCMQRNFNHVLEIKRFKLYSFVQLLLSP